jgi:hypothetical protein
MDWSNTIYFMLANRAACAFIIRKGQVVWSYDDPAGKGEISDAILLSNGLLPRTNTR